MLAKEVLRDIITLPLPTLPSLVSHMESDTFLQSEDTCVCVLKNIRGMLLKPPELNDAVSSYLHVHVFSVTKPTVCIIMV